MNLSKIGFDFKRCRWWFAECEYFNKNTCFKIKKFIKIWGLRMQSHMSFLIDFSPPVGNEIEKTNCLIDLLITPAKVVNVFPIIPMSSHLLSEFCDLLVTLKYQLYHLKHEPSWIVVEMTLSRQTKTNHKRIWFLKVIIFCSQFCWKKTWTMSQDFVNYFEFQCHFKFFIKHFNTAINR